MRVIYLLFVLGGWFLGYAVAAVVMPDEPAVGRAAGLAAMGLAILVVGQQSAKEDDESSGAE